MTALRAITNDKCAVCNWHIIIEQSQFRRLHTRPCNPHRHHKCHTKIFLVGYKRLQCVVLSNSKIKLKISLIKLNFSYSYHSSHKQLLEQVFA